jgi:hypothetical protein
MPDDKLAARVAVIRDRTTHILAVASPSPGLMRANEGAYAALESLLAGHSDAPIYLGADRCEHPEPQSYPGAEHDRWLTTHPIGTNPDSRENPRVCLLTEIGRHCPACTELAYGEEATGDDYVHAENCVVRPTITRALLGEGVPDGDRK